MQFELTQFDTTHKKALGSQHIEVNCIARHPRKNSGGFEEYEVWFYRDPITGWPRNVYVSLPEHTTEDTLSEEAIKEIVFDYLMGM